MKNCLELIVVVCLSVGLQSCETMASSQYTVEEKAGYSTSAAETVKARLIPILEKYGLVDCTMISTAPNTVLYYRSAPDTRALGLDVGVRLVNSVLVVDLSYRNPGSKGIEAYVAIRNFITRDLAKYFKVNILENENRIR